MTLIETSELRDNAQIREELAKLTPAVKQQIQAEAVDEARSNGTDALMALAAHAESPEEAQYLQLTLSTHARSQGDYGLALQSFEELKALGTQA